MAKIGLFDSGVGGLSVLRAITRELPDYDLVYFADQKYCPYGPRPPREIRALSARITKFLIEQNCRVVVVACNTASAAALYFLRETFPVIAFIGMEPAVKPAASATRSGKIAVLATRGTLEGELFGNTRDEFAREIKVNAVYPPDWVERVERGDIDSPATFESVRAVIEPLLDAGVDEIALGCTHYPFLAPLIEKIANGRATILDPSDAVAKQTARVIAERGLSASRSATQTFYTSGELASFQRVLTKLLGVSHTNVYQTLL
ncbi:MAG: glutamate racemase [Chloroflexi bacterium UTCFX4]|nr:MAG: glutamate racemase [Chloroflexi bacterium UTCFX4]